MSAKSQAVTWRAAVLAPVDALPAFIEALASGDGAVSAFETASPPLWCVEGLYVGEPDRTELLARVAAAAASMRVTVPDLHLAPLEERDWIAESLKDLKPVDVGRFRIHGSHDRASRRSGAINLEVDAGRAFGTGQHETTRGCLLALGDLDRRHRFRRPLDLGCGTGILALAAARLWRRRVTASDIDRHAVAATEANARINRLGPWIRAVQASGLDHPALVDGAPYDLIVANILANPLVELSGPIARHLTPGGIVVLSGLLDHQQRRVAAAYRIRGFRPLRRFVVGRWPTLVFRAP